MRDKNDPIYHDVRDDKAEDAILRRFNRWLDLHVDDNVAEYFCEHGRYVGFGGALAYMCERCTPGYED